MKNLGLKSFSIIIALFLFFYVHSQGNSSQRPIVVPVEIKNLPPDKFFQSLSGHLQGSPDHSLDSRPRLMI